MRAGIHHEAKYARSYIESALGKLPESFKLPKGFRAKLAQAHKVWAARNPPAEPAYPSRIDARLRAHRARKPEAIQRFRAQVSKALEQVQARSKVRVWTPQELLAELGEQARAIGLDSGVLMNAGGPGKAYKDRWFTTVCQLRTNLAWEGCRVRIGRTAYGTSPGDGECQDIFVHFHTILAESGPIE